MKTTLSLLFLLIFSKSNFGQLDRIDILLLRTDTAVAQYYNSLNSQKPNANFKIEKQITVNGDLVLVCKFGIHDESYFKCLAIMAIFERIDGDEYCVQQSIVGSEEYANFHLAYIKDTFKSVSVGKWEKSMGEDSKLKLVATFEKPSAEKGVYEILYEIVDK